MRKTDDSGILAMSQRQSTRLKVAPERFGECIDEEAMKNDSLIQSDSSAAMSDSDDEDYHDPSFVISSEAPTPLASSPDVKNLRQVEPPSAAATNPATTEPVGVDRDESPTTVATNLSTTIEPVGLLEKGNDEQDLSITPPMLPEVSTQDIECMSNVCRI